MALATLTAPPTIRPAAEVRFRIEVAAAYQSRFGGAGRESLPVTDYELAEGFLRSVMACGASRAKVVSVTVEVLTGVADRLPGRHTHMLRSGTAGSAHVVKDGAPVWRTAITVGPAARRLHYQRLGGRVVLRRVSLHDDFRP